MMVAQFYCMVEVQTKMWSLELCTKKRMELTAERSESPASSPIWALRSGNGSTWKVRSCWRNHGVDKVVLCNVFINAHNSALRCMLSWICTITRLSWSARWKVTFKLMGYCPARGMSDLVAALELGDSPGHKVFENRQKLQPTPQKILSESY